MDIAAAPSPFMAQLMGAPPRPADKALPKAGGQTDTQADTMPNDAQTAARDVAKRFEAMIIGVMLEPMFAGIKTDGPFGGGSSETVFKSMLIQEYAKSISNSGGIGVADSVYKQMLKLQEQR